MTPIANQRRDSSQPPAALPSFTKFIDLFHPQASNKLLNFEPVMTVIPPISTEQMLAPLPASLAGLRAVDQRWQAYRQGTLPVPTVVTVADQEGNPPDWDVVIGGGTLGILLGVALVQLGWRVALLERGILRGREQEWNISRAEITHLVTQGLLTEAELEQAIATEYNPARIQFGGGDPLWVKDILNVGIDPVYLLETLKQHFIQAGGTLLENTPFDHATVHGQGVTIHVGEQVLNSRLFIDAMGHFSPLVQQVRQGKSLMESAWWWGLVPKASPPIRRVT